MEHRTALVMRRTGIKDAFGIGDITLSVHCPLTGQNKTICIGPDRPAALAVCSRFRLAVCEVAVCNCKSFLLQICIRRIELNIDAAAVVGNAVAEIAVFDSDCAVLRLDNTAVDAAGKVFPSKIRFSTVSDVVLVPSVTTMKELELSVLRLMVARADVFSE